MKFVSLKNVGPPHTPQEIKRLRRESGDMLRRYGQPVVHFSAWNLNDLRDGTCKRCPACLDSVYQQARSDCEVCFGTTLVSIENSATDYIDSRGYLTQTPTDIHAPAFGGYREPVLTRMVEPDVGVDIMRWNDQGVLIRTQNAQGMAFWTPYMGDNDMIINVTLGQDKNKIVDVGQRYQLKMVNPMTVRGWGARSHDQSYNVGQQFEMNSLPLETIQYRVPLPVRYDEL